MFCMATAVSEGSGPKPAPIRISSELERQRRHVVRAPSQRRDRPDRDEERAHRQQLVVAHAAEHLAGEARAGVERHHEHHQAETGIGGRKPHHPLQIDRQKDVEPDDGAPAEGIGGDRAAHDRILENGDRDQRLGRRQQAQHEQHGHDQRKGKERQDRQRRPGITDAGQVQRQHERHARAHDQRGAEEVEEMRPLVARKPAQQRCRDRQRRKPHRNVDPEDDRPMQMVGDQAAEQRAAAAGGGVGRGEVAVIAAALLGRDQIGEHDHAHGRQPAAAEAVQDAAQDQHQHVRRQRADQRAGHIGQDRDAQREPAPMDVRDLAVERDDRGRCQQIGGDQPGQVVHVAEIAPDRRQRRRQNGLVERAHERRQQHAEHDQQGLVDA